MNYFDDVNTFYKDFYKAIGENLETFFIQNEYKIKSLMKKFPVYTIEDIKFRLIRDIYQSHL